MRARACASPPLTRWAPAVGSINGVLPFDPWSSFFYYTEWVSIIIFTVEYLARLATSADDARGRLSFVLQITNIIDLAAWLPFWITGFSDSPIFAKARLDDSSGGGASFIRAVRLVRVFRIFKSGPYAVGIKVTAM